MTTSEARVYPLQHPLSEEQIAVTFAMTSRNPDSFDEIAQQVSETRAADFNERWVVGYGHSSVAEHAVVHLAVENFSRLAVDRLESNRLASYTEKSSRYQVMPQTAYHIPAELEPPHPLADEYVSRMNHIFDAYRRILELTEEHLRHNSAPAQGETESRWRSQIGRAAMDYARAVLPAATLTNVGVTANARSLEHTVSKLMSAGTHEERTLGKLVREQGREIAPTLLKYAAFNPYLTPRTYPNPKPAPRHYRVAKATTKLLKYQPHAMAELVATLLFHSLPTYSDAYEAANQMTNAERKAVIAHSLDGLSRHDAPPREFEAIHYLFESVMDYGALREFRRHRMQSTVSQPLTVKNGYHTPPPIADNPAANELFDTAMASAEQLFRRLNEASPYLAPYAVTHAHYQSVLYSINLRQCYPLFTLRTAPNAHYGIQAPMRQALAEIRRVHPELVEPLANPRPIRNRKEANDA